MRIKQAHAGEELACGNYGHWQPQPVPSKQALLPSECGMVKSPEKCASLPETMGWTKGQRVMRSYTEAARRHTRSWN